MAAVVKKRKVDAKPVCKYGSKCYRRNPQHLQNYRHPGRDDDSDNDEPKPQKIAKKKTQKKTIGDYFSQEGNTHNVSESDSEKEGSDDSREVKEAAPEGHSPSVSKENKKNVKESSDTSVDEENDVEEEDEAAESPPSPEDVKENIKAKFLVEMPEDFYHFWDFCKSLHPSHPADALQKCLDLRLVGPFDVLAGRHKGVQKNKRGRRPNFLLHYRYFYDPPEFQTVVASSDDSKFHLGYYRDDPKEAPVFVASNSPGQPSKEKLYTCGDNLFAAIHIYASKVAKSNTGQKRKSVEELIRSVEDAARKHDYSLAASSKKMKDRQKKVVCPTFHGAGIVVPVDDNEVGYRPVPETPADLRAMFKKISESKTEADKDKHMEDLQELITLVQFANDECDYGEGLELGLDLFSFGSKVFHPQISTLLPLAYQLLDRQEFSKIIEAHLKHRRGVTECVDELAV